MQNRLSSDLEEIFATIKNTSLLIFEVLKYSMGEYTQNTNKTGDLQLQADILADKIIQDSFRELKIIQQICSEEQESAIKLHNEGI